MDDSNSRFDDPDRGFERPPPKNPELFNPKGVVRKPIAIRPNNGGNNGSPTPGQCLEEVERYRAEGQPGNLLMNQMSGMTLEDRRLGDGSPSIPFTGVDVVASPAQS